MAKNPVVHFEMGYNDKERMVGFYEKAFGWVPQRMGPEMGEYVVEQTAETDENGMVRTPGQVNGGFYAKTEDPSSHAPSVVIAVEDIHAAMKRVTDGGGRLAGSNPQGSMEPTEIPGIGLWMSVYDTEGNRVSLLQPHERA